MRHVITFVLTSVLTATALLGQTKTFTTPEFQIVVNHLY